MGDSESCHSSLSDKKKENGREKDEKTVKETFGSMHQGKKVSFKWSYSKIRRSFAQNQEEIHIVKGLTIKYSISQRIKLLTFKENLVLHVLGTKSVKGKENTMFNVSPQAAT